MSADLKREVERKKQRLEELRKRRNDKTREVSAKEVLKKDGDTTKSLEQQRADIDDLVKDLIGPASSGSSPSTVAQVSTSDGQSTPASSSTEVVQVTSKKKTKLIIDHQQSINIKPKEITVYEKYAQTDIPYEAASPDDDEEHSFEQTSVGTEVRDEKTVESKPTETKQDEPPAVKVLTDDEKKSILQSKDFTNFIDQSSRIVERALAEPSGLFYDMIFGQDEENLGSIAVGSTVTQKLTLFSDRWTKGRTVTFLNWSDQIPEILLAAYDKSVERVNDPDGLVLLWNTKVQMSAPEYVFQAQSPVLCTSFAKFHPSYILGGTYSGQVVLWDIRSSKKTPVQRSPLSNTTHTHPIYCLKVVGTQNAHNLITISTDGRLCSWSLDMLSQPQECLDMQSKSARAAAASCMDFPDNEVNKLLLGSDECDAYLAQRHGSKPGVSVVFKGHSGPITGISLNKAHGQPDFSHLFLTSSLDWTVKLWSLKLQNEQQISEKTGVPVCSFEMFTDYVYDVQWSPKHPAVFATADGSGKLQFWNINHDFEEPIINEQLDFTLSKLSFSESGNYVAAGDESGKVTIYELGEGLYTPHQDEWLRLQQRLATLPEIKVKEERTPLEGQS